MEGNARPAVTANVVGEMNVDPFGDSEHEVEFASASRLRRPFCFVAEPSTSKPGAWHVTQRLASLRGEERANVLRVVGVAVFYAIEVLNYRGLELGPIQLSSVEGVDATFHAGATALAVAWMATAAAVLVAVKNHIFPPALKYISTGADLFLIVAVLTLADGPRSPVLLVLFLIIVLAGLRLHRRLVAFTTLGAVIGYGFLIGDVRVRRPELAVPAHWQITTFAALILCGVVVSGILVEVERAVRSYAALERGEQDT